MTLRDRVQDALAAVAPFVAVAQFDRLVRPGRCAGGNRRTSGRAADERDFDFQRRISARIEDLAAADGFDHRVHLMLAPFPRALTASAFGAWIRIAYAMTRVSGLLPPQSRE